jgi:hypothetical protein
LVSQLREDLLLCSSYLPLGVPNGLYLHTIKQFFGAVAGEEEDFYKGSLARTIFYFVFVFVNLNPFMQQMFLKLHDIEDSEKKDFILETLRREFRDVAIEARKVFEHFNMLGSPVVGTNNEYFKVPIPSKLLGLHEALENNFDWICPENLFSELNEPKRYHKGSSKTYLDAIQCLVEKTFAIDLNASFDNT